MVSKQWLKSIIFIYISLFALCILHCKCTYYYLINLILTFFKNVTIDSNFGISSIEESHYILKTIRF